MILDAQNLHCTYLLPKPSNSRSATLQVLVLDAIFLFAHCFERCVVFFGYVAPFLYCCRQLDPLLYSVGNIRTRHDVRVTDNC